MSRSTPPPRNRHSSLRTPLIAAVACVALTIPGTVAARSESVHQQAAPASNVVAVPKLTVLYPNDADVKYFAAMSPNGAHVYLGSATDLVNDGGATESSQPWDVIPYHGDPHLLAVPARFHRAHPRLARRPFVRRLHRQ